MNTRTAHREGCEWECDAVDPSKPTPSTVHTARPSSFQEHSTTQSPHPHSCNTVLLCSVEKVHVALRSRGGVGNNTSRERGAVPCCHVQQHTFTPNTIHWSKHTVPLYLCSLSAPTMHIQCEALVGNTRRERRHSLTFSCVATDRLRFPCVYMCVCACVSV